MSELEYLKSLFMVKRNYLEKHQQDKYFVGTADAYQEIINEINKMQDLLYVEPPSILSPTLSPPPIPPPK